MICKSEACPVRHWRNRPGGNLLIMKAYTPVTYKSDRVPA